ncbi:MAG: cyclopropane fatty acyl phospholipid synthase [Methylococcus sp.]|nr:cyclopropane fatty acyl phospholipid synthase [Methylococcus sp.]
MPINTLDSFRWPGCRHDYCKERLESLLEIADVRIDGGRPWDLRVHNPAFFRRIFADASLGLGESYVDGWWDCARIDELIYRIVRARLPDRFRCWRDLAAAVQARFFNLQHITRAFHVGQRHYDIGNDLYSRMLDRRMIYSCGYWKHAQNLEQAQEAKLDLVFRKIGLKPGMRVLDIGCGWGGAAKFAAEKYGAEVYGVTVSAEQARHAREVCRGLPVTIELKDYRDIEGRFDRAYSLGMFEHVGCKNYSAYMNVVADRLAEDGLFLLHTIGSNVSDHCGNLWVERYIFPNSMLPSIAQIGAATENRLVVEDWQNFGPDYDRTLLAWHDNFECQWTALRYRYGDRFYRMWRFYLLSFAGAFRARYIQLWQLVLSPQGLPRRYDAPR